MERTWWRCTYGPVGLYYASASDHETNETVGLVSPRNEFNCRMNWSKYYLVVHTNR
jgi:hypothetical protein